MYDGFIRVDYDQTARTLTYFFPRFEVKITSSDGPVDAQCENTIEPEWRDALRKAKAAAQGHGLKAYPAYVVVSLGRELRPAELHGLRTDVALKFYIVLHRLVEGRVPRGPSKKYAGLSPKNQRLHDAAERQRQLHKAGARGRGQTGSRRNGLL